MLIVSCVLLPKFGKQLILIILRVYPPTFRKGKYICHNKDKNLLNMAKGLKKQKAGARQTILIDKRINGNIKYCAKKIEKL